MSAGLGAVGTQYTAYESDDSLPPQVFQEMTVVVDEDVEVTCLWRVAQCFREAISCCCHFADHAYTLVDSDE